MSYHDDVPCRGFWDNALLDDMFAKGDFQHYEIKHELPELQDNEGGVVVINGRSHGQDINKINEDINKLEWCVFIIAGDEESVFPWEEITHPKLRVWVMLPRIGRHNDVSFKIPNGYPPQIHEHLPTNIPDKTVDFYFAGQITHRRRKEMAEQVQRMLRQGANGEYHPSQGFTQGLAHEDYYLGLWSAKIALCPSGPESPDSFRVYEALEAGCLPIVDAFATNNEEWGFWKYLFGDDLPFPVIDYWSNLPALLPELLKAWPHNANKAMAWWIKFKRDMFCKLEDDIQAVSL